MLKLRIFTWNINNKHDGVLEIVRHVFYGDDMNYQNTSISNEKINTSRFSHKNNHCDCLWIFCFQETPLDHKLPPDLLIGTDLSFYHKQYCSLLTIFVYNKKYIKLDLNSFYLAMAPSFLWKGGVLHFITLRCSVADEHSTKSILINDKTHSHSKNNIRKHHFYSFALVNLHLKAHIHNHEIRINQIRKLLLLYERTCFITRKHDHFEQIFLAGDFNTRSVLKQTDTDWSIIYDCSFSESCIEPIREGNDPSHILAYTETKDMQMSSIKSIFNLNERPIRFAPTYKISRSYMIKHERIENINHNPLWRLTKYIQKLPFINAIVWPLTSLFSFFIRIFRYLNFLSERRTCILSRQSEDKKKTENEQKYDNKMKPVHSRQPKDEQQADIKKQVKVKQPDDEQQYDNEMKLYSAQHIPSWCDRILFRTKTDMETSSCAQFISESPCDSNFDEDLDNYNSLTARTSDHLPVFANFMMKVNGNIDQTSVNHKIKSYLHLLMKYPKLSLHLVLSHSLSWLIMNTRIILPVFLYFVMRFLFETFI